MRPTREKWEWGSLSAYATRENTTSLGNTQDTNYPTPVMYSQMEFSRPAVDLVGPHELVPPLAVSGEISLVDDFPALQAPPTPAPPCRARKALSGVTHISGNNRAATASSKEVYRNLNDAATVASGGPAPAALVAPGSQTPGQDLPTKLPGPPPENRSYALAASGEVGNSTSLKCRRLSRNRENSSGLLLQSLKRCRTHPGLLQLRVVDRSHFLAVLGSEDEKSRIFGACPFQVNGRYISLQPWQAQYDTTEAKKADQAVWVNLLFVNPQLEAERMAMMSKVGPVLHLAEVDNQRRSKFAHVRGLVLMSTDQNWQDAITVDFDELEHDVWSRMLSRRDASRVKGTCC